MVTKETQRFWEIDFLRGIAIIMMVIYHIIFDLNFLNIYEINLHSIPLLLFLYPIGILFLLLVGISLSISYSRVKQNLTKRQIQKKFVIRGLKIFSLGLLITIVTWFYPHYGFVKFGILHCIGISIILAIPFLQLKTKNLLFGVILLPIGIFLKTLTFDIGWLFWLGLIPSDFYSVDYFPLLPWFGVVLIGIFIGNSLYPEHRRIFNLKDFSTFAPVSLLCFLGQHSLIIYLVHQPIIVAIFSLISLL